MNRRCICVLFLLTAGLCSAVPGRTQISGHGLQPAVSFGGAADANGAQARNGGFTLSGSGGRRELAAYDNGSIDFGSWLLPGRILEDQLQTLTRLEHFAAGALVAVVLSLIGFLYWKRQAFRRRIWSLRISPQELECMMRGGHAPPIIDLRNPLDMLPDPRMIPGAIRITQEEISVASSAWPKDRDVVLYCTCPKQKTSIDVAARLVNMGFARVRLLSGGFQAWKQLGYELHDAPDEIHWPSQMLATPGPQSAENVLAKGLTLTPRQ
ncbi:MAG TPA: rhodanese-like domain-containing protein [Acidobacteriaceae bacterium]